MITVRFTAHLNRWFPGLSSERLQASTLPEMLTQLDAHHPGLSSWIVDERGALRQHVNIFINREMIHDRKTLGDPLQDGDEVHIFQALSGG